MSSARRITVGIVAVAAFLTGTVGLGPVVGGSPASAGPVDLAGDPLCPPDEEPPPLRPPASDRMGEVVPAQDRQHFEGENGTRLAVYLGMARCGPIYSSDDGPGHAEEIWEGRGEFNRVLEEARVRAMRTGEPAVVTIVVNHTPCHEQTCELALIEAARLAQAYGVPLRIVFTGAYTPHRREARTRFGQWIRAAAGRYDADVFVAGDLATARAEGHPDGVWPEARRFAQALEASGLFSLDGPGRAAGPLVDGVSEGISSPGGIDFTSLEPRYLAELSDGEGLRYAFRAGPSTGEQPADLGLTAAQQQSDAFFVWLSLPPSAFWVKLDPGELDRIIDERLGRTEAGRILLEADLRMKQTTAQLIHPDTPLGAQLWRELESGPGGQSCVSFRQWIVPATATIREDEDELHILDAPLSVQLETDYVARNGGDASAASCPGQDDRMEERNEDLLRSLVLPRLEQAVNEAPEYAELRRVYLSRLAAEWYRQRSRRQQTAYGHLVDRGDVGSWPSRQPWLPREVFDRYVASFTEGEFDVTRERREGDMIFTHTYFFGGVDFSHIDFDDVEADAFRDRWPELQGVVDGSFSQPAPDGSGGHWLGSVAAPAAAAPHDATPGSATRPAVRVPWYLVLAVIGVCVAASRILPSIRPHDRSST